MTFAEQLNRYLEALECPANRLSKVTGIPPYSLSKYRNGSRRPEADSKIVEILAEGIRQMAQEKNVQSILNEDVAASLRKTILFETDNFDFGMLSKRVRLFVKTFGVTLTEIAEQTHFGRSTLYAMWRGKTRLRDPEAFVDSLARYIVTRYGDMNGQMRASKLIGWPEPLFDTKSNYQEAMTAWLTGKNSGETALSEAEPSHIGAFEPNEYQKSILYEPIHLAKMPVHFSKIREYTGMKGMEDGIRDFIRVTAMGKSYKDIILYSEFPITQLLPEQSGCQLWGEGLSMALHKGIAVRTVHHTGRPPEEIREGVKIWIPLYMSGQILPLYMEQQKSCFRHCILASGSAVLRGSGIEGNEDDAVFRLFIDPAAVEREYRLADQLAALARPLTETYTVEKAKAFEQFLREEASAPGKREADLSAPPIYTISDGLLSSILERNAVSKKNAAAIRAHVRSERKRIGKVCESNEVHVHLGRFTRHEFNLHPVRLDLSKTLLGFELLYTSEEYEKHIIETREFEKSCGNYHLSLEDRTGFRNIQIIRRESGPVLVSKNGLPNMHLLIRQNGWMGAL